MSRDVNLLAALPRDCKESAMHSLRKETGGRSTHRNFSKAIALGTTRVP